MTDEQLRDEIMTLFLAGHDTTANTLSWTWYLLAQNPKADAALEQNFAKCWEIARRRQPDLPRLPYTEMVMKESMRLYPPAWGVGRRAIHDFELDGYRIPARTNFFLLQWVTQRDPRFFPDPERFDPRTLAPRPNPDRQNPPLRLLPLRRRPQSLRRRRLRHDGSHATPSHNRPKVPPNPSPQPIHRAPILSHPTPQKRHPHAPPPPHQTNSGSHDDAFLVVGLG